GTRSKDGRLQVFKGGAFKLAKETNVAVVPITIQGATQLLPKGSFVPSAARVVITVHPKINSGSLTEEEIMQTSREFIRTKLESALSSGTID
ncbi:MAG: 1-acyl-sn-glycerol-3-phosphate acyltransferase, partial [Proteobacteria bacterium]|nr:1-acyl-sn-glycerol-3-phosphate acyltransferase [Pseudomonadota bacterium]